MNGPQHYAEAERLLALATQGQPPEQHTALTTEAQVHATLAAAAATVDASPSSSARDIWAKVLG